MLTSLVVIQTAARLGITSAQVALQWLLQLAPNVLLIPGTGSVTHLRENLAAEGVTLDDEALRTLDGVGTRTDRVLRTAVGRLPSQGSRPCCSGAGVRVTVPQQPALYDKRGSRRSRDEEAAMAQDIDREGVRRLMEQGAQIVDVLPTREYGEDHLPGAINLPLRRIEAEAARVLDPSLPVVVYCADSG